MKRMQRGTWILIILSGLCLAATSAVAQSADKVERVPANPDFPFAAAVVVPAGYDTLYISGHIPKVAKADAPKGSPEMYGDTKTQTTSVLQQISDVLAAKGLTMADVVMVHVYLAGDPAKDGKMDFAGMNSAFVQFFGSKDQPLKPARSTVQVAALAAPGALVEIEAIAVRKHLATARPLKLETP